MRYIKMLGLAIVASAALMALVGAGTASATVFCKAEGGGGLCPGEGYAAGQEIHAVLSSGTKAKLKTEVATVECSESTIKGETSSKEGTPLSGPVSTLSFGSCNCEVKVLKAGTISTEWIEGTNNGTLRSSGAEITTACSTVFGNVHCIYKTETTDLGTLTGGNPATIDVNGKIPHLTTSFLCSEEAQWEASYEVTTPKPLYVSGGEGESQNGSYLTRPVKGSTITFGNLNAVQQVEIENTDKKITIEVGMESIEKMALFKHVKACAGEKIAPGKTCTDKIECLAAGESGFTINMVNLGQSTFILKC